MLENVSLSELIDIVARRLKINYLLDPHFKGGSVTIHTYGEMKSADLMPLLETILRVNGAALVKVGDLYRVVPVEKVSQMPLPPSVNGKDFPDDERMALNLVFLKYATAGEILKLIQPFLGEGAAAATYDPANLLILQDNNRNMKRTMDLLALFDSDSFVSQRVHLYEVSNGRPTDLVKQLESVFKAVSLSDKAGAVKFVPVDRINTIADFAAIERLGVHGAGTHAIATSALLGEIAGLVADGSLELPIARTFPLADVREAYTQLAERRTHGKIVLIP